MMTRQEIIRMIERNMKNSPNPMIDYETAMKALRSISKLPINAIFPGLQSGVWQ